jgi:hypothetical protein
MKGVHNFLLIIAVLVMLKSCSARTADIIAPNAATDLIAIEVGGMDQWVMILEKTGKTPIRNSNPPNKTSIQSTPDCYYYPEPVQNHEQPAADPKQEVLENITTVSPHLFLYLCFPVSSI